MKINIKLIALSFIIISCLCLINDITSRSLRSKIKNHKALSKSGSRSKSKSRTKADDFPWTREVGMSFIMDLSKLILDIPGDKTKRDIFMQNIFQFCFNKFENDDNPNNNNLETAKQLWTYLSSLPLDTIKANFKTTRYQNTILLKMASIEVVDDNQNSTCMQSMTLKDDTEIDKDKVAKLFKKTFAGFTSPRKNAKPFMNSHYDRYRSQLPDDAFINMNIQSGGGIKAAKEDKKVEQSSSSLQKGAADAAASSSSSSSSSSSTTTTTSSTTTTTTSG